MKRFVLFFLLLLFSFAGFATDYYSQGSLDPGITLSWGILPSGGTAPTNFTTDGDKFIIQTGHTMTTVAAWTIGNTNSSIEIQSGGILQGNHLIQFTGTFYIDSGGKYVHNNLGTVSAAAGASIWGGAEIFAAGSTVEIQKWINNTTTLPAGIPWGNLVINVTTSIGGNWNQASNLTTVQGKLQIISSGTGVQEFQLSATANLSMTIGDSLIINGGVLNIKSAAQAGITCYVQVNGSIRLSGGKLNIGVANAVQNTELRYTGDFSAVAGATVTSGDNSTYLVANGTTQALSCATVMNCNFRVAPGSIINLNAALTVGLGKEVAVLGTFNQGTNNMTVNATLETAAGVFNSAGLLTVGINCRACMGNGTYNSVSGTWCTTTGTKGTLNLNGATLALNTNVGLTSVTAGHFAVNSPGDIYLINTAANTSGTTFSADYSVFTGSVFSIDGGSYIAGTATTYRGQGGTLRIGSVNGITASGNFTTGNVRVSGTKTYNFSGTNSFEYFGTSPQATGNGLPATIAGKLIINNAAGLGTNGLTLTQAATVNGEFVLTDGKLTTVMPNILYVGSSAITTAAYANNSFVNGIMSKYGNSAGYKFPVGSGVDIHPIEITTTGGDVTDLYSAVYFKANPSTVCSPGTPSGGIDHVSQLEYWLLQCVHSTGTVPANQITLTATGYSNATDRSSLVVTDCSGGTWVNMGNANAFLTGAVGPVTSSSSITGPYFVNLTLASTDPFPVNPLPIHLLSFDASKLTNKKSTINWELADFCSTAAKFEIQRAGTDKRFVTIGTTGGSETNRLYNFIDNDLKNGINYYRLKIIDTDAKITYSRIVAVMNGADGLLLTSFIPTVVTNLASLTIASSNQQKLDIVIADMQGRVVLKRNYTTGAGNSSIELSLSGLAAGVYQLTGISSAGGKTNTIRFIKQ